MEKEAKANRRWVGSLVDEPVSSGGVSGDPQTIFMSSQLFG